MNRKLFVTACAAFVLGTITAAASINTASGIGVWQGKLEGLPGVTLTLADDAGDLGGTIVFNAVDSPHNRIIGIDPHVLLHTHIDGNRLSFEVKRTSDSREVHITVTLAEGGKAQLHCLDCGSDSPATELVKAQGD
jgi:hypothetical protein